MDMIDFQKEKRSLVLDENKYKQISMIGNLTRKIEKFLSDNMFFIDENPMMISAWLIKNGLDEIIINEDLFKSLGIKIHESVKKQDMVNKDTKNKLKIMSNGNSNKQIFEEFKNKL